MTSTTDKSEAGPDNSDNVTGPEAPVHVNVKGLPT